jgi:alcohol dehydrogenase class IV
LTRFAIPSSPIRPRSRTAFSEIVGREAIRLTGKYLLRAYRDGADMEAREGIDAHRTLRRDGHVGPLCHLAHDIGRFWVSKFHLPHGSPGPAAVPQVLSCITPAVPGKGKIHHGDDRVSAA